MTTNPLEVRALDAHHEFEKDIRGLYHPRTGLPRFPEGELKAQKETLRAVRNAKLAEVELTCRTERREQEESLEKARHAPPTSVLTGDELQAASSQKSYVEADVSTLAPKELEKRLAVVLEDADRPTKFAYREALRARIRQLQQEEGYRFTPFGLSEGLEALSESLLPTSQRERLAVSKDVIRMVDEAREVAYSLRRGDKTSIPASFMNEKYKDSMKDLPAPSGTPGRDAVLPGHGAAPAKGAPPQRG